MFCPRCGQQQVSGEVRFCSRCGFTLSGVVELLAAGGALSFNHAGSDKNQNSPRRRGVRQGGAMMIIGLILTPLLAILSEYAGFPEGLIPLAAIIFFWGGILRILYALVFQEGSLSSNIRVGAAPSYAPPPATLAQPSTAHPALPPPQSVPFVTKFDAQRVNTAEMAPPPSVTEHTTKLLNDETELRRAEPK